MSEYSKIEESRARVWKVSELRETLKECVKVGFEVTRENDIHNVFDPVNKKTVLRAIENMPNQGQTMVRISANYFDV